MRVVFMGTPGFARVCLEKLLDEGFEVVGVFTQPDKPQGRKMVLTPSEVKVLATERGIPVFQPEKMRDGIAMDILRGLRPDILAVVAYGRILPDEMLALPRYGAVNVHGSLLPRYRGASPIQWSVLNGDETGGVTTQYMAREMDRGDIIYTAETPIAEKETSGELYERLAALGAELLVRSLRDIEAGTAPRIPQDESLACYVGKLDKSLSPIDFDRTPRQVLKWIFGLQPWPVATMELDGTVVKVFDAERTENRTAKRPGELVCADARGIEVACAKGETIRILELQAPGKKRMRARRGSRRGPERLRPA